MGIILRAGINKNLSPEELRFPLEGAYNPRKSSSYHTMSKRKVKKAPFHQQKQ
jgi:hypothetical protein